MTICVSNFFSGELFPCWATATRSEIGDQVTKHQAWHLATSTVTLRGRRDINFVLRGRRGTLGTWRALVAHWHVSPCLIGSDAGMFRMFRFGPRTWEAHWHKCHARHAKRRLMSPSATPAMQSAASLATNGPQARHQSQPSRTSATPAMQKEG